MAHELTHVVQHAASASPTYELTQPGDTVEREADHVADRIASGRTAGSIGVATSKVARDLIEFETDPKRPGLLVHAGPTQAPKWIDRILTQVGYNVWLGYGIWVQGEEDPIIAGEDNFDFTLHQAAPISDVIYNSRQEALAAVETRTRGPSSGPQPFAYYWGAGGRLVLPTIISPATAPLTAETAWGARVKYSKYVETGLARQAMGMLGARALGSLFRWVSRPGAAAGEGPPGGTLPKGAQRARPRAVTAAERDWEKAEAAVREQEAAAEREWEKTGAVPPGQETSAGGVGAPRRSGGTGPSTSRRIPPTQPPEGTQTRRGETPGLERQFEPPYRDHFGKVGGEIPKSDADRKLAVDSWNEEELESAAKELEPSIAARNNEQRALGETSVGPEQQRVGAQHRDRIRNEEALLRAILKKLSGS